MLEEDSGDAERELEPEESILTVVVSR